MYDTGKVVAGLFVFVVFVTMPIWWQAFGKGEPPTLDTPKGDACIEEVEYMRASHMDLLNDWRNDVVRDGVRQYEASDGTVHEMSLTNTCLDCHESRTGFCTECHDYSGVRPLCWECHVDPEEVK